MLTILAAWSENVSLDNAFLSCSRQMIAECYTNLNVIVSSIVSNIVVFKQDVSPRLLNDQDFVAWSPHCGITGHHLMIWFPLAGLHF